MLLSIKRVPNYKTIPWYNQNISEATCKRHRLERVWKKTKKSQHYINFYRQCWLVANMLETAERSSYIDSLAQTKGDKKIIYNICSDLQGRDKNPPLPPCECNEVLTNRFNTYFSDKISMICKDLESTLDTNSCDSFIYDANCTTELTEFNQLSLTQVKKILTALLSKSHGSDPITTTLLIEILPSVIDFITAIVNQSLQEGDMLDNTKESLIKPLLKKANLDLLDINFRPISNVSFISKLTERCVASNIVTYAEQNNLMEPNQTAYHQHRNISVQSMCRHSQSHGQTGYHLPSYC